MPGLPDSEDVGVFVDDIAVARFGTAQRSAPGRPGELVVLVSVGATLHLPIADLLHALSEKPSLGYCRAGSSVERKAEY
jgi:hypothetical protein